MKKRTAHLAFCGVYCILALIALLADFEIFGGGFSTRPFVFYTSLSNMLCSAFMVVSLIRNLRHREVGVFPRCKFLFVVMILLTALVFNLFLNYHSSVIAYFAAYKNALHHLILPVMFVLDWLIFYKRGTVGRYDPALALGIPLLYVIYILLRAFIAKSARISVSVLYPYFFLNVDSLGWLGFLFWMGGLLAMLLFVGYGLHALDRLLFRKSKTPDTNLR